VDPAVGKEVAEVCCQVGLTEIRHYASRQEYGGLKVSRIRSPKELEWQSARVRRAVLT